MSVSRGSHHSAHSLRLPIATAMLRETADVVVDFAQLVPVQTAAAHSAVLDEEVPKA